jgi:hypothetical protein
MQIIFGIIITAVGVAFVLKTEWFLETFGRIAWFDEKLGSEGGTRLGYKLIGVIALFIGIILMTGSGDSFFGWALSPLTKYSNPGQ